MIKVTQQDRDYAADLLDVEADSQRKCLPHPDAPDYAAAYDRLVKLWAVAAELREYERWSQLRLAEDASRLRTIEALRTQVEAVRVAQEETFTAIESLRARLGASR